MNTLEKKLRLHTKIYLWTVIVVLFASGVTAFPIETELAMLIEHDDLPSALENWILLVHEGLKNTNSNYPFLAYGTDWLAFAHLMLAILFLGPLRNPIRNIWIVEFGIICCVLIIPLALIAGSVRQIPIFWRLIDCSFGVIGIIPLILCYRNIKKLELSQRTYCWGI